MAINRRQFLLGAGGLAAAATTGGLTACAPGARGGGDSGGDEGGTTTLALAWWGNPTRNKNTQAEIDAYLKANPNVKIEAQPGEFASYWEKLATQTAGGTAPDIIQMDMAYISEYGNRGALLDLSQVDVSKFVEGTVESGKIDDKLVGINAGINSFILNGQPDCLREGQDGDPGRHHLDLGRADGGRHGGCRQGERAVRRGADLRLRRDVRHLAAAERQGAVHPGGSRVRGRRRRGVVRHDGQVREGRRPSERPSRSARKGRARRPSRWTRVRSSSGKPPCSPPTPTSWKRSGRRPGKR